MADSAKNKNPETPKQTPEKWEEAKQRINTIGNELAHLERRLKTRELELQEKGEREKDEAAATALLKQLETA